MKSFPPLHQSREEAVVQERAVVLAMDSPEVEQLLSPRHLHCRVRVRAEERECAAEADRYRRVASMLSLHRPLFLVGAEEQGTQRVERAAGWDRSVAEAEPSCHHLHPYRELELAAEVGVGWALLAEGEET